MEIYGIVTAVIGAGCLLVGTVLGYGLRAVEEKRVAQKPEWRTDTVDGAIEWAQAALDARKDVDSTR